MRFLEELLCAATPPPSIRMDLSSPTHAKSFPLQSLLHPEQREVGTGQKGATGSALALRGPEPSLCPRWATKVWSLAARLCTAWNSHGSAMTMVALLLFPWWLCAKDRAVFLLLVYRERGLT